jgi:tRNA A-37 threonylcarbamoyl transferase component Bud32
MVVMPTTGERMLAGRYRLEQVIGRGGMSTVYRATDQVLGRTVAVKVLLAALIDQDPNYGERFAREARAAAALASPSVVTVYDTGIDAEGERYIVMEYVAGHSLAELLADGRPLEIARALAIAERVAEALRVAHAAGILHRDIKPANVMVADDGTVKVLDFGIARRLDGTTLTQAASVVGTAGYMAPERALGKPGDARSDLYSLGCLLYAMLTGRPPFTGEVPAALLHQQVNVAPSPPSAIRTGISPGLDALVLEMLAKDPRARPPTAERVRDRLRALAGLPLPPSAASTAATATAATARLGGLAPTLPLARAATAAIARATVAIVRPLPSDHRRRAVVMSVLTALVALVAVALLSSGGGGTPRASHHVVHRASGPTTSHSATTHAASTPTTARTTPTSFTATGPNHPPSPAPAPAPKPAGPQGPAGNPPGHGGKPPGKDKGHGGPGGD